MSDLHAKIPKATFEETPETTDVAEVVVVDDRLVPFLMHFINKAAEEGLSDEERALIGPHKDLWNYLVDRLYEQENQFLLTRYRLLKDGAIANSLPTPCKGNICDMCGERIKKSS